MKGCRLSGRARGCEPSRLLGEGCDAELISIIVSIYAAPHFAATKRRAPSHDAPAPPGEIATDTGFKHYNAGQFEVLTVLAGHGRRNTMPRHRITAFPGNGREVGSRALLSIARGSIAALARARRIAIANSAQHHTRAEAAVLSASRAHQSS